MDKIVHSYRIIHCHWSKISGQYDLRISKRSVYQHGTWHSGYCIDGSMYCSILMWGASPTKNYLFLLLQQILHKLWGIEDPIISVVSLDNYSMPLRPPLKGEFLLDSFSSVYCHLVIDDHITTGMVNKYTSSREHLICIGFAVYVVEPTWIPQDIVICI